MSSRGLLLIIIGWSVIAGTGARADESKLHALADGDFWLAQEKIPRGAKVKECCGYPVGERQDFRLSFYWLAYESEYANERYDVDIYDKNGWWLGRYPSAFVYELTLEGTGILRDGRVVNYDGQCEYGTGTCFAVLDPEVHPLGRGVQARQLVPFRSVAVDPRYIPIGSPIYVPEIVGMTLPDGTTHDGCLRADDMGGAIKLHKLDFFVESYFNFKFLADQQWWHLKATPHLDEPRCEYLRVGQPREHDNEHVDWATIHSRKYQVAQAQKARASHKRQLAAAQLARRRKHALAVKSSRPSKKRSGRSAVARAGR